MSDTTTRNMCSVIDAIDFIVRHEDKLTSTERSDLKDPLNVSRALFRRLLGKLFSGFEIRKNAEHYSVRCDNPDMYKVLNLYNMMHRLSYLDRLDASLYEQLEANIRPLSNFFSSFSGTLSYKFRDENRFFIYVSYMPYTRHVGGNFNDVSTFNTHSMGARLERLTRMYDMVKDLKPTPITSKFLDFMTRFGQWSLGYLPRSMGRGSVTEEFIDYALAAPREDSLLAVGTAYMDSRQQLAAQERQQQQEERRRLDEEARAELARIERERQGRQPSDARAPQDAQQRFAAALSRISRERPPEEVTAPQPVEEAPVSPTQDLFNAALARIRTQHGSTERFLRLDLSDIHPASIMSRSLEGVDESFHADTPRQITEGFVDDNEYIRLLGLFSQHRAQTIFRAHTQDVFDDLDTEHHGVYFTMGDAGLRYHAYAHNRLIASDTSLDTVLAIYRQHFGEPGEIRYLEEISYARNEH